ncbi:MAG: ABC transporter permease [Bacteroidales bacterium]|nr:ABC transporter permease [Bacteroidales bacterium]
MGFRNKDVDYVKRNFTDLQYLSAAVWVGGQGGENNVVSKGKESASFTIIGDSPDRFKIDVVDLENGRPINNADMKYKRKAIYIGQRVYETLFKNGETAVGSYVKVNGVYFMVVGVFKSQHSGQWAFWQNGLIFMPLPTAQQTFNLGDQVHWMSLCAIPGVSVTDIGNQIMTSMKVIHKIHPDDTMAFGSNNIEKEYKQMSAMFLGISILIWVVGIFTLLAGVIGISNIMLIVIKERTKEIGIRRAIGAKPFLILIQIVYESVMLTLVSGYLGMLAGIGIVELMAKTIVSDSFKEPEVDITVALLALAILTITGLIAGLIPATKALKIKPVEALRYE